MLTALRILLRFAWRRPWLALLATAAASWVAARRAARAAELKAARKPVRGAVNLMIAAVVGGAASLVGTVAGVRFFSSFLREAAKVMVAERVAPVVRGLARAFAFLKAYAWLAPVIPWLIP